MQITSRKDYPITTNFPSSLETLLVVGCNLKKVDSRMLKLRNLMVLDLSHNCIRRLPEDLDRIQSLSDLNLAGNQIEDIPKSFCESSLVDSLHTLDLSHNKLKIIKPWLCKLKNIVNLKLDNNEIVVLPAKLGSLKRLRNFTASKNQLRTLPVSFIQLRLENLDLFDNHFLEDGPSSAINRLQFPTLLEVAARAIYKMK